MRIAVPVFPGSSDALACVHALEDSLGVEIQQVWHKEADPRGYDGIIIPGGSSYGDYLRPGAIAARSPMAEAIRREAVAGTLIIGIGNGYQILLEMGLLPGAILLNDHQQFHCDTVTLRIENNGTAFTGDYEQHEMIRLPIAHRAGNYYCDASTYAHLRKHNRIVLTYQEQDPNGSTGNIAGIVNERGNVFGLMPHPERAGHPWMGSEDGKRLWTSMYRYWREKIGA